MSSLLDFLLSLCLLTLLFPLITPYQIRQDMVAADEFKGMLLAIHPDEQTMCLTSERGMSWRIRFDDLHVSPLFGCVARIGIHCFVYVF